ncbi:MAG: halocyanin, partial [Halobacteria archaeon]|nr:halocyanin [Halobacteria archaeon]
MGNKVDRDRRKFMATSVGFLSLMGVAVAQNDTGNTSSGGNQTASEGQDREPTTHEVQMVSDGSSYYFDPVGLHV